MTEYPKVLVGCPTSVHKKYCLQEYVDAVKNLSYPNYDVVLVDNSDDKLQYSKEIEKQGVRCIKLPYVEGIKKRIVDSRNILRDLALKEGYDFFFSLEQDVIPPKDVIERLISYNKPIVLGVYTRMMNIRSAETKQLLQQKEMPLLYVFNKDFTIRQLFLEQLPPQGLIQVITGGLGCVLIHKEILKEISFRFEEGSMNFDDTCFFQDILDRRIFVFCDCSVRCKHLEQKWSEEVKNS